MCRMSNEWFVCVRQSLTRVTEVRVHLGGNAAQCPQHSQLGSVLCESLGSDKLTKELAADMCDLA